jgi:leucyl aminopeptidase
VPDPAGGLAGHVVGLGDDADGWAFGDLPNRLPAGLYRIDGTLDAATATTAALAWSLGGYRFDRYLKRDREPARLALPEGADLDLLQALVPAITGARDLINTPAQDMGPQHLAAAAQDIALRHGAEYRVTVAPASRRSTRSAGPPRGRRASSISPGAIRRGRASRWWARASASTPAGST